MTPEFRVNDVFRLPNGATVLACEGDGDLGIVKGFVAKLLCHGDMRQSLSFSGEWTMLNQAHARSARAFQTLDEVQLSVEEAQSGAWTLCIDDQT